jgi:IMP dehydrogenase
MKEALSYDDILLVPSFSTIKHRSDIDLRTLISRRYGALIPIIASPMDTICEKEMAFKMFLMGGVGCIHRFMSIEEQAKQISELVDLIYGYNKNIDHTNKWKIKEKWHSKFSDIPIMAAIGIKKEDRERAEKLVKNGANILLIDVAHGHHQNVIDMIKWCKEILPDFVDIIAGNIVTGEAANDLENAGADGLRTGIGGGSLCTTRSKTGFGVPNVTALEDVISVAKTPVIADGGIKTSGDIAKAIAMGASSVMIGSLLAGTEETPGKIIETPDGLFKRYRGSASLETKVTHNQEERNVEGESTIVPFKGGVKFIINGLTDGIKSALSYNGSQDLNGFRPEYVVVTNAGIQESKAHLLK